MRGFPQKLFASLAVTAGLLFTVPSFAADEDPAKSVELRLEGQCDPKNSRLWLVNSHGSKAIIATLRWNLSGSKRVITEQFQVAPGGKLEIGCAAQADIVVAAFAG
jgi:hypothetical protein